MNPLVLAFSLVLNGVPQCEVVVPADAHPATVTAAEELTNWVGRITGAGIRLRSKVEVEKRGERRTISFALRDEPVLKDTDGYLVEEKDGKLTIVAKYPKGHLNAVFRLLFKNTDVIWPRPGTEKEPVAIYSRCSSLDFHPSTYAQPDVPAFRLRHCGYNTSPEGMRWDMRNALVTPGNWRWFWRKPEDAERGRRLGVWDSYYNTWGGAHNMVSWWFPYKEHQDHPEFYMLTATGRDKRNGGLCVSNPDLPKAFGEAVLKKLADRKSFPESVREVAILMEDSDQSCCCEACSAPFTCYDGTVLTTKDANYRSTRFFDFFTRALQYVWEKYPDLVIRQYAYVYLSHPPRVKVPKNLKLEFCPYPRNMKESVFEGPSCTEWRRRAEGWAALTRNLFWREYYFCGCIYYPRPISDTAAVDLRHCARLGMPDVYCDGCAAVDSRVFHKGVYTSVVQPTAEFWDTTGVEKWTVGQLMWDPGQDPRKLREEYLRRVFREAAPAMIRFYGILNASWYKHGSYSGWQDAAFPSAAQYIVQAGCTKEVREALDEAAKTAVHPVAREWVAHVSDIVERWIKEAPKYVTGPLRMTRNGPSVAFPHFKLLKSPDARGAVNEPYDVEAVVKAKDETFEFSFRAPHAAGETGAPEAEVQFSVGAEKALRRYAVRMTEGGQAWTATLRVPFAEIAFEPIRINTIRCAPIVTYAFGGLGKDLPVSWQGALPCVPGGWGELVVELE